MLQTVRHRQILALLREHGECSVDDLALACGVSEMTIRRDLQRLTDEGRVTRTHGGAAPADQVSFEFQFLQRLQARKNAKDAIGRTSAHLVQNGQSVMLDSGTTTLALARYLKNHTNVTVITTSLPVASVLQQAAGVETLLLGGYVRKERPDLEGALTDSNLESLRADVAFVGADGIDLEGNVYNASLGVGRMLAKMVASSAQVYVVADSSKLGKSALIKFGNVTQWKGLITDNLAAAAHIQALRDKGVTVTEVEPTPAIEGKEQEMIHHG